MRPNAKRRSALFLRNYADRGDFVRGLQCITQRTREGRKFKCHGQKHASHAVARGMGGVKGDATKLVTHCAACHEWFGRDPTGYQEATGLDVLEEAARIDALAEENLGPLACYKCGSFEGHAPMCKTAEAMQARREQELQSPMEPGEGVSVVGPTGERPGASSNTAVGHLSSSTLDGSTKLSGMVPDAPSSSALGVAEDEGGFISRWLPPEGPTR